MNNLVEWSTRLAQNNPKDIKQDKVYRIESLVLHKVKRKKVVLRAKAVSLDEKHLNKSKTIQFDIPREYDMLPELLSEIGVTVPPYEKPFSLENSHIVRKTLLTTLFILLIHIVVTLWYSSKLNTEYRNIALENRSTYEQIIIDEFGIKPSTNENYSIKAKIYCYDEHSDLTRLINDGHLPESTLLFSETVDFSSRGYKTNMEIQIKFSEWEDIDSFQLLSLLDHINQYYGNAYIQKDDLDALWRAAKESTKKHFAETLISEQEGVKIEYSFEDLGEKYRLDIKIN